MVLFFLFKISNNFTARKLTMNTISKCLIIAFYLLNCLLPAIGQEKTKLQIADSLVNLYASKEGPGLAVKVLHDGRTIFSKELGYANMEDYISITDSTAFHIASVSKQFTVLAALLLENKGLLSMDDDIKKYLPELKDLPYAVAVRQLANHTHGFPNTFELAQLIGIAPDEVMTHAKMVKLLLGLKELNFVPGSQYQYNNAGFTLLAEIVSRVSGMPFASYVQQEIFDPLDMKNSVVFDNNSLIVPHKAYAYRKTKNGLVKTPYNYSVVGGSGINTTATDLALWALNFEEAKVGNEKLFETMKRPSMLNDGSLIPYGLGLETKDYRGQEVVFHGGGDAGYRSYIMRIPAQHFAVVILGNLESFNPLDLAYSLTDLYLGDTLTVEIPDIIPQYTTAALQKWAGDYEIFPGSFFTLLAKDNGLYIQPFGSKDSYLLPVIGEGVFKYPYAAHSKFVFDHKGMHWHFSDFAYPFVKVNINPPTKVILKDFEGLYWNEELRTIYKLHVEDGQLLASHALNTDILLKPLTENIFYADAGYFGRVTFKRNKNGQVLSFNLAGQNINNLKFVKVK